MIKYAARNLFRFSMLLLLGIGVTATAQADDATLVFPEAIDIQYVDGVKHSSSIFSLGSKDLDLSAGEHKLILIYDVIWEVSSEDHDRIMSESFMIKFKVEAGHEYQLSIPEIEGVRASEAFAEKPAVKMVDTTTNQPVAVTHSYRLKEKEFLSEFEDSEEDSFIFSAQEDKVMQQLKHWWGEADNLQRKEFLEWMKSH